MYITLNRQSEWVRALLIGLDIDGHALRGAAGSGSAADVALMVTGSIDSFEHDHVWDRTAFDWSTGTNTNCRVSCYSSDSKMADIGGELTDLDTWLTDGSAAPERRANLSEYLFSPVETTGGGDGLLCCRGRYLWLRLDIIAEDRAAFEMRSVKLRLPSEHLTDYLPEVYTKGLTERDFFPRFMAVFESIFFNLEEDIDRIGERLDYRTADAGMLAYMATWLGIKHPASSAGRLRSQIGSAIREFRMAGTKEGLVCAVEEQTGHTPVVVEHFQVDKMAREGPGRHTYARLFGSNPYKIYIMLPSDALSSREKVANLTTRIRSCVPAHVSFEIVPLRGNTLLDRHTYLDVNSSLSGYSGMVIEEESILRGDVYLGKLDDEDYIEGDLNDDK